MHSFASLVQRSVVHGGSPFFHFMPAPTLVSMLEAAPTTCARSYTCSTRDHSSAGLAGAFTLTGAAALAEDDAIAVLLRAPGACMRTRHVGPTLGYTDASFICQSHHGGMQVNQNCHAAGAQWARSPSQCKHGRGMLSCAWPHQRVPRPSCQMTGRAALMYKVAPDPDA